MRKILPKLLWDVAPPFGNHGNYQSHVSTKNIQILTRQKRYYIHM